MSLHRALLTQKCSRMQRTTSCIASTNSASTTLALIAATVAVKLGGVANRPMANLAQHIGCFDIQDLKNESALRKQSRAPQAKHEIANFGNERTNKRFEVTQLGAPESMSAALNQGQNKVELFKREPTNGLVFRGQHVF